MRDEPNIQPQTLAELFPLCFMTEAERQMLSEQLTVLKGKKGKCLVEFGGSDNKALYVLNGKIKVETNDGQTQVYENDAPQYKSPISFANPHKMTVTCLSTVEYFRLENHVIANLLERKNASKTPTNHGLQEHLRDNPLFSAIYQDLIDDNLIIPTLPKVAVGVRKAIENDVPVRKIELLIQADPALATLLVKTANSALYRTRNTASTIEQAIMRMGLRTVKQLVTSYSLKHLFRTEHKAIKQRMKDLWIHSTEVAAVSYVLAKHLHHFDPEQALLMGLLHNIGMLPVLSYAERYPDIASDENILDATVNSLKAEVGAIILAKWQFSQDFITVAKDAENWMRDSSMADYADLVLVAKLHTFIGREHQEKQLPQLFAVPAFHKLGLDQDDPNKGLSIIADANEQINEIRSLLAL
ncbi:HDOD domain-containing protein [Kaarinaea lacus]